MSDGPSGSSPDPGYRELIIQENSLQSSRFFVSIKRERDAGCPEGSWELTPRDTLTKLFAQGFASECWTAATSR